MRVIAAFTFVLYILTIISGCGDSNEYAAISTGNSEDPRFATADALIEFYNDIVTTGPRIDWKPLVENSYSETALHERIVGLEAGMVAVQEFRQAIWDEFESEREPGEEPPLAPGKHRAAIVERTGDRAIAHQTQNDGSNLQIHLVNVNGRWWFSYYTEEYDPEFQWFLETLDTPESMEPYYAIARQALPSITQRIRSGEFATVEQAEEAMREAMLRHAP